MHFPSASAIGVLPCESGPCEYAYVYTCQYMCENCMTIMLNIHFVLLTIGQMTHTSDSTTHYYLHYSHRSIISLHSKLQDTVTFFRLAYTGCYFFSQPKLLLCIHYFFPVTFFPSSLILSSLSACSLKVQLQFMIFFAVDLCGLKMKGPLYFVSQLSRASCHLNSPYLIPRNEITS